MLVRIGCPFLTKIRSSSHHLIMTATTGKAEVKCQLFETSVKNVRYGGAKRTRFNASENFATWPKAVIQAYNSTTLNPCFDGQKYYSEKCNSSIALIASVEATRMSL